MIQIVTTSCGVKARDEYPVISLLRISNIFDSDHSYPFLIRFPVRADDSQAVHPYPNRYENEVNYALS